MKCRTETNAAGHLFQRGITGGQQSPGLCQPKMNHVLPRRISRQRLEFASELAVTYTEIMCKSPNVNRICQILEDVLLCRSDNPCNSSVLLLI